MTGSVVGVASPGKAYDPAHLSNDYTWQPRQALIDHQLDARDILSALAMMGCGHFSRAPSQPTR